VTEEDHRQEVANRWIEEWIDSRPESKLALIDGKPSAASPLD